LSKLGVNYAANVLAIKGELMDRAVYCHQNMYSRPWGRSGQYSLRLAWSTCGRWEDLVRKRLGTQRHTLLTPAHKSKTLITFKLSSKVEYWVWSDLKEAGDAEAHVAHTCTQIKRENHAKICKVPRLIMLCRVWLSIERKTWSERAWVRRKVKIKVLNQVRSKIKNIASC